MRARLCKLRNRKAFTIVELVIVIAVIAILSTVLVPAFGSAVDKARDSKAIQTARSAYTAYVVDAAESGKIGQYFIYQADETRFVAIDSGGAVGVYATAEEALEAMVPGADSDKLNEIADSGLSVYGAPPVTSNDNVTGRKTVVTAFEEPIVTLAAQITLSPNAKGGAIFENHTEGGSFFFGIDGDYAVLYRQQDGNWYSVEFSIPDYKITEPVHLATVINGDFVYFYINGSIESGNGLDKCASSPTLIGSDFDGEILSLVLYSDIRTESEIRVDAKTDINSIDKNNLIAAWDFTSPPENGVIKDLSGNGYDIQ